MVDDYTICLAAVPSDGYSPSKTVKDELGRRARSGLDCRSFVVVILQAGIPTPVLMPPQQRHRFAKPRGPSLINHPNTY